MIITGYGLADTPRNFAFAEEQLLQLTDSHAAFWSGRAATGLYYAYRLAAQQHEDISEPEVIVPAMMCATAANTAYIAGLKPRFADVVPETGLVNLETIKARHNANTVAVVIIHLLGQPVDIDAIAKWCSAHNILLIEDPTHTLTGCYSDGRITGSVGDVSIYSFNPTKIISIGNGVLVSKREETARALETIIENEQGFGIVDEATRRQLAHSYRNLHHSLVSIMRLKPAVTRSVSSAFMTIRETYDPLYLRPANTALDLNQAWRELTHSITHRYELAEIYANRLQHPAWQLLTDYQVSGVCWRFSMLINAPEQQVAFSDAVRADGFHVSNLYWAANQFFRPDDECPGADYFSRRIVNLWVDPSVDESYVRRCCDSLLEHAALLGEQ